MCWNKEVSLITFVLAIVGVVYLYHRNNQNDRWVAVFAAVVAMIQSAEYFMWSDLQCGTINKYASMFALLVLIFEPFMNMIGGLCFSKTSHKNILKYMLLAYIIFIGYSYFTYINNKQINWCGKSMCPIDSNLDVIDKSVDSTKVNLIRSKAVNGFIKNKSCNLHWHFMENMGEKTAIIWILFLMLPFLTMTPTFQAIILFTLGVVTLAMASATNNAAIGSLWCWFAIAVIYCKIFVIY